MEEIGKVISFYVHPSVAAIEITNNSLRVGDKIKIKGHTTDFEQEVESMQIEHKSVKEAKVQDKIGLKVRERVRPNDLVYKL